MVTTTVTLVSKVLRLLVRGSLRYLQRLFYSGKQVIALGPSFNTTLALMQSLSAVAYVDDDGFAYVARRNKNQSLFLTEILNGKFKPEFLPNKLSSSSY